MTKIKISATLLLMFMLGLANYSISAWVVSDGDRKYILRTGMVFVGM